MRILFAEDDPDLSAAVKTLLERAGYSVDAVDNGLADAIGTREDAIKKAAELAGVTDYDTTNLVLPSYDISSLAYLFGDASSSTDELVAALRELQENQNRTK